MGIYSRERKSGRVYYITFQFRGEQRQERAGTSKRAAEILERQRKREVTEGTYSPAAKSGSSQCRRHYDDWRSRRTNRTASDDHRHVGYLMEAIGDRRLVDIDQATYFRALMDVKRAHALSGKTMRNVDCAARAYFDDALECNLIGVTPYVLSKRQRGEVFSVEETAERQPYTRDEVRALTTDSRLPAPTIVLNCLSFYLGTREGETCGRRWRDWDRDAAPLTCMHVATQYNDQPLKGSGREKRRPRKVPVHPELAGLLDWWWSEGFALHYLRTPTLDDFIVPNTHPRAKWGGHTKSSLYKAFQRALEIVSVPNRTLHSTRHTMITWARRGGANKDALRTITHNPKGDILDQYTHLDWQPLCDAVMCIDYRGDVGVRSVANGHVVHHGQHPRRGTLRDSAESRPQHVAAEVHVIPRSEPNAAGFDSRRLH